MTLEDAQEFCEKWLPAWSGNNPKNLADFYDNKAVYLDPANPSGLKGRDSILTYFTKLLAKYPDWSWKVLEIFPTEKGFVLKWEARVQSNNSIKIMHGLDIVEVYHSRILRNEVYFDSATLK